ncbi:MAG: hypothetical protein QOK37_1284 [Thermoanaerobaculia bacterium]|jgi:hypothetical protein|nr:hypothetical protein [Thermoanaerobaculia bacterium]
MILQRPVRQDFEFKRDVRVDVGNEGFTPEEIQELAPSPDDSAGTKGGASDLWKKLWSPNRKAPPALQNLKSEFGYQSMPILTDLIAVAAAQKTPLEGTIEAKAKNYNFYIMRCGVYIAPDGDEKFEALKFRVRYKTDGASTFSMLPGPQVKKLLELGGTAEIGLNGKAEFGFPEVKLVDASVSAAAKANLEAKFIVSFEYELKAPVVDAFGVGNSFCRWLMHKGENLRNDVVFYPVIMTPKKLTELDCEFSAYFKISHPDWKHAEFFLKPAKTIHVKA